MDWTLAMPPFAAKYIPAGTMSTKSAARFLAVHENRIWRRSSSIWMEPDWKSQPARKPSSSSTIPVALNPGHPIPVTSWHVDVMSSGLGYTAATEKVISTRSVSSIANVSVSVVKATDRGNRVGVADLDRVTVRE